MKVALVHDWLTGMRGGERMLERVARMWPEAPIYTLAWKRGSVSPALESHPIVTSFIQRLPLGVRHYRWYLPLYPAAIESFDFTGYDVLISTSHAAAKAAIPPPEAFHFCYVHTPMRYVWDLERQYFPPGRFPWPLSWAVRRTCARLRAWDVATLDRVHAMVTNSGHVAGRIRRHYGRDAEVIGGPVELARFEPAAAPRSGYLFAGAFAPNKRGDLAVEACRRLGRRLTIVGRGQEERALRRLAGADTEFRGWVSDEELPGVYAHAQALLFPGEEDLGLMPIEAMASGCPVVALARGGALETVGRGAAPEALARAAAGGVERVPGGVLFGTESVEGLIEAIRLAECQRFEPAALRAQAEPFSAEAFDRRFRAAFERAYAAWKAAPARRTG